MRPQHMPLIFVSEQAAPLQDGDDLRDEDIEQRGQDGRHDIEAIRRAERNQSSMRSATCSGVPAMVKWPRAPARLCRSARSVGRSRATREVVTAARLRAAWTCPGSGKSSTERDRSSSRCEKSWPPNRLERRARPTLGSASSFNFPPEPPRLLLSRADHRAQAREDQDLVARAAQRGGLGFQVSVELGRRGFLEMRGEDRLRMPRGELPARLRGTGLHEDRAPLRRPRQVERPLDTVMRAHVVDAADPAGSAKRPDRRSSRMASSAQLSQRPVATRGIPPPA